MVRHFSYDLIIDLNIVRPKPPFCGHREAQSFFSQEVKKSDGNVEKVKFKEKQHFGVFGGHVWGSVFRINYSCTR